MNHQEMIKPARSVDPGSDSEFGGRQDTYVAPIALLPERAGLVVLAEGDVRLGRIGPGCHTATAH